ncbi:MAG: phenylalanine--tRNA ligase subunit beta [candidate division WOR-3 bacterium]
MPVVTISPALLCRLMGKTLSEAEIARVLAELGCDIEEIDSQTGALKINLLPARPDLFDVCGLARALKGYLGIETGLAEYRFPDSGILVWVKPGLEEVRPFIASAVVRGLRFDDELVGVVMDLQENLHWGLGRDRRRASIGIYDLNTITPDIVYQPVRPDGVRFVPLGGSTLQTPEEILATHPKGQAYRHLLDGLSLYPLLADSKNRVLSMPPIINSEQTRVTPQTADIFIDVTGPEPDAVCRTLNVIAAVFADLGGRVERVKVQYPDGRVWNTPEMSPEPMVLELAEVRKIIGISLDTDEAAQLLRRMRYGAEPLSDRQIRVLVPPYRSDVMHTRDLIEDIAIAYGYHRLKPEILPTVTASQPRQLEEFCALVRRVMTGLGFIEIMSLNLSSPEAQFAKLGIADDSRTVVLENPISVEQRILRRHLLAGIMETFSFNSTQPYPQKIFEIGDIFTIEPQAETGARSRRHLGFGIADARTGFAELRQVLEALFREMDWELNLTPDDRMPFIAGRSAAIISPAGVALGYGGEIHPEILERLGVGVPVVLAEVEIEALLRS